MPLITSGEVDGAVGAAVERAGRGSHADIAGRIGFHHLIRAGEQAGEFVLSVGVGDGRFAGVDVLGAIPLVQGQLHAGDALLVRLLLVVKIQVVENDAGQVAGKGRLRHQHADGAGVQIGRQIGIGRQRQLAAALLIGGRKGGIVLIDERQRRFGAGIARGDERGRSLCARQRRCRSPRR